MKIIKEGKAPTFTGVCSTCDTVLECTRAELDSIDDPGYDLPVTGYVACPICTETVRIDL